jgi:hypothetical protein
VSKADVGGDSKQMLRRKVEPPTSDTDFRLRKRYYKSVFLECSNDNVVPPQKEHASFRSPLGAAGRYQSFAI